VIGCRRALRGNGFVIEKRENHERVFQPPPPMKPLNLGALRADISFRAFRVFR
jgi:hypothetical protein